MVYQVYRQALYGKPSPNFTKEFIEELIQVLLERRYDQAVQIANRHCAYGSVQRYLTKMVPRFRDLLKTRLEAREILLSLASSSCMVSTDLAYHQLVVYCPALSKIVEDNEAWLEFVYKSSFEKIRKQPLVEEDSEVDKEDSEFEAEKKLLLDYYSNESSGDGDSDKQTLPTLSRSRTTRRYRVRWVKKPERSASMSSGSGANSDPEPEDNSDPDPESELDSIQTCPLPKSVNKACVGRARPGWQFPPNPDPESDSKSDSDSD